MKTTIAIADLTIKLSALANVIHCEQQMATPSEVVLAKREAEYRSVAEKLVSETLRAHWRKSGVSNPPSIPSLIQKQGEAK